MYIKPQTKVYLLSGVPLDDTYEHTIYFTTSTYQNYYFIGNSNHRPAHFTTMIEAQSFQDPEDNIIRCELNYKDILNCNYMCFNAGYVATTSHPDNQINVNKWYYCFIKKIRYINNNVTEIHFEVDVMQTYLFDYQLKECFIDREHSATDGKYENTIPENLDLGNEYVAYDHFVLDMNPQAELPYPWDNGMKLCILINNKPSDSGSPAIPIGEHNVINNVYMGCNAYYGYWNQDYLHLPLILNSLAPDDIVAIYQYPSIFGSSPNVSEEYSIARAGREFGTKIMWHDATIQPEPFYKAEYMAKNQKMCCYPFTKLQVSDNAGHVIDYKYEMFRNYNQPSQGESDDIGDHDYVNNVYFQIKGVAVTDPAIIIYPKQYRQIPEDYDNGIVMANFPVCSWGGDAFKSWWAANKNQYQTGLMTSTIGTLLSGAGTTGAAAGAGFAAAGPAGAVVGGLVGGVKGLYDLGANVKNQMAKRQDMKEMPSSTYGSAQTSSLNAFNERYRFDVFELKIKKEYAIMIDQYFSRYGYKTNKIKVPNRRVRKYWTYTKTCGCAITETVANDIAKQICAIYDNGITFWCYESIEDTEAVDHLGDYAHFKNPNLDGNVEDIWGFYNPVRS